MREILFKAKRWADGKWVLGDLLQYQDGAAIHHYVNGCRVSDAVDPRTVCQYTGLLDSAGVKIFEGDIVENRHGVRGVIRYGDWNCGCCYDVYGYVANELGSWDDDSIRVVGNIHDAEESDAKD